MADGDPILGSDGQPLTWHGIPLVEGVTFLEGGLPSPPFHEDTGCERCKQPGRTLLKRGAGPWLCQECDRKANAGR